MSAYVVDLPPMERFIQPHSEHQWVRLKFAAIEPVIDAFGQGSSARNVVRSQCDFAVPKSHHLHGMWLNVRRRSADIPRLAFDCHKGRKRCAGSRV